MPKSGLAAAVTIPSATITALLTNSSPVVAAVGALAVLILAIGVARALVLTAKNGRMNITIGPVSAQAGPQGSLTADPGLSRPAPAAGHSR